MKVLGISASPRTGGNTELLLKKALEGAESAGARVEFVSLRDKKLQPCNACRKCYKDGKCPIQDDCAEIIEKILDADRLILAGPVYFMTVNAQCKMLIDRCQFLWVRKYVLHRPVFEKPADRRAMIICVGATRGRKMFESVRLTMKRFLDVLEMNFSAYLTANRIDRAGDILKYPAAFETAFEQGRQLVSSRVAGTDKPVKITLI